MVDTLVLGTSAARYRSSSLLPPTIKIKITFVSFIFIKRDRDENSSQNEVLSEFERERAEGEGLLRQRAKPVKAKTADPFNASDQDSLLPLNFFLCYIYSMGHWRSW